jgi:O-antigen ligase
MALFRSDRGIGRGEVAESRLEVPIFAAIILLSIIFLFIQHLVWHNMQLTIALAVSMMVFSITVVRVDFGVYILIIAMLLSPEIEAGNALSGERTLKFRYDDLLIIVIFMGVMVKLAFEGRVALWQPSPINPAIAIYYTICVFTSLMAWGRGLGAWDKRSAFFVMLKMLEFYLIFFMAGHAIRKRKEMQNQIALFFIVAMIVSLFGIYSIGDPSIPRVSAPFEKGGTEPNTLGGYLVIIMCVALGLFTQARPFRNKLMFLALAFLAFVPFLHTLSRASYMGFIVGLTTISIISRKFYIFGVLVLVLAFSSVIMPVEVVERVAYTFQQESGHDVVLGGTNTGLKVDKSTHERFEVWKKVKFILKDVGIYYTFFGGGVSWESVLDSQYARVILESGLMGMAAFLFLQFTLLKTARQAYRWTDDWFSRGISMGMFGATLALIVHSFGTISFLIVRIMEPYWLLIAMTVVIRNQAIESHHKKKQQEMKEAIAQSRPNSENPPVIQSSPSRA